MIANRSHSRVRRVGPRSVESARSVSLAAQRGVALVEMAIALPVLLTIMLGVIDLSRAIQFDNVITHLSREGANLAARVRSIEPAGIVNALASTAAPLRMNRDGMIYFSEITGQADGTGQITRQFRAAQGNHALQSRLWRCTAWQADSSCLIPASKPAVTLPVPLRPGETVWAVETRYEYRLLTGFVLSLDPDLYAITIM